jgi:hypothetical protein
MRKLLVSAAVAIAAWWALAAPAGDSVHVTGYHLTAHPWKPLNIARDRYLDAIEGVCRFSVRHQDASGAIIDPFLHREHQYATPYFAYAVGVLVEAGRAHDLLASGIRAMEHATSCFGSGAVPDNHGEFFIPSLTEALDLYAPHIPQETLDLWRERMKRPRAKAIRGSVNNWETYAMKGEWLRSLAGLANRQEAVAFIENAWQARQRQRIAGPPWSLYHDRSSDPDTLSVEAVGRGNLLALVNLGYDGPSAGEIRTAVESGTRFTLLLQDPSGQVPANGRTDDHVWVDVGYQLAFEVMARRAAKSDPWLAGQFRHAAMQSFQSIARWRRADEPWEGSYFVTKNRFDPALRVGYQTASQYSNYNGSLMFHLAEAYRASAGEIEEHPSPAEIGGYALATDQEFSSVFGNAGGMQIQANLRGQVLPSDGNRWTPLGVVRFARTGWDTRLGPSDGALTDTGGVSFAPTFFQDGKWLRMADLSGEYEGAWSVAFVHPLLVRCAIEYHPVRGRSGPSFRNDLVITPDGVYSETRRTTSDSPHQFPDWGVTWPILENDGNRLVLSASDGIRSVQFPGAAGQQNFISLEESPVMTGEQALRSSYGDLVPVRVVSPGDRSRTFVYPRTAGQPDAATVRRSFRLTKDGFSSALGKVSGTIYAGPYAAGGFGREVDFTGDGVVDASFSEPCGFLIQLREGQPTFIETDRAVQANFSGHRLTLMAHVPLKLEPGAGKHP